MVVKFQECGLSSLNFQIGKKFSSQAGKNFSSFKNELSFLPSFAKGGRNI